MKKIFLIAAAFFTLLAHAQTKEGRVVYECTMQMPTPPGDMPPELKSQLPKSRTMQYELLFTPKHSLRQALPNAAGDDQSSFVGGGMVIRMMDGNNEQTYVDLRNGTRIDQRELFEKDFVVTDSMTKLQWKLGAETKPVLTFTVRKATATTVLTRPRMTENGHMKRELISDTLPVVAWYTTEAPVPARPDFQGQLPDLILELDINNGQSLTKAIEFSPKVTATKVKSPNDGKMLTAAEFDKEREKMMEEVRKNRPDGNFIRMN